MNRNEYSSRRTSQISSMRFSGLSTAGTAPWSGPKGRAHGATLFRGTGRARPSYWSINRASVDPGRAFLDSLADRTRIGLQQRPSRDAHLADRRGKVPPHGVIAYRRDERILARVPHTVLERGPHPDPATQGVIEPVEERARRGVLANRLRLVRL